LSQKSRKKRFIDRHYVNVKRKKCGILAGKGEVCSAMGRLGAGREKGGHHVEGRKTHSSVVSWETLEEKNSDP